MKKFENDATKLQKKKKEDTINPKSVVQWREIERLLRTGRSVVLHIQTQGACFSGHAVPEKIPTNTRKPIITQQQLNPYHTISFPRQ